MARNDTKRIQSTRNYRLFARSDENRALCLKKHKKLYDSMRQYGFLPSFPVVCVRNGSSVRVVKDGQHRIAIAEELGLPVYFVDEDTDFDVAVINCTPKTWTLRDYAEKYAAQGNSSYMKGVEFAERHGVPIGMAFSLLAGTISYSNIAEEFTTGKFRIKDEEWAECVGSTYASMVSLSTDLRTARFLDACMAIARVEGFDPARLVHSAKQCRDKLVAYSTREAFLDMIEYVYNFKRQKVVPMKFLAIQAMHDRNVVSKKKAK